MTREQYLIALKVLNLQHSSRKTAALLGVTVATLQNYACGRHHVPKTVEQLLTMYLRHGLPDPEQQKRKQRKPRSPKQ